MPQKPLLRNLPVTRTLGEQMSNIILLSIFILLSNAVIASENDGLFTLLRNGETFNKNASNYNHVCIDGEQYKISKIKPRYREMYVAEDIYFDSDYMETIHVGYFGDCSVLESKKVVVNNNKYLKLETTFKKQVRKEFDEYLNKKKHYESKYWKDIDNDIRNNKKPINIVTKGFVWEINKSIYLADLCATINTKSAYIGSHTIRYIKTSTKWEFLQSKNWNEWLRMLGAPEVSCTNVKEIYDLDLDGNIEFTESLYGSGAEGMALYEVNGSNIKKLDELYDGN